MPYTKLRFSRESPGLIIILVDQSASMAEPYGGSSKMETAAMAVNDCLYEIVIGCTAGNRVHDRCQLALIAYGNRKTSVLFAGWVSEVAQKMQGDGVWLRPKADGDAPMHKGFDEAAKLIREGWLVDYPGSFPPYVLNITIGKPTYDGKEDFSEAEAAAKELTELRTSDGNVLLFNAHLAHESANEFRLPDKLRPGASEHTEFLFRISSRIPEPMFGLASAAGLELHSNSRGCLCHAGADGLARMMVFGSMLAVRRARAER